jgi:signal transduction histidine kinase
MTRVDLFSIALRQALLSALVMMLAMIGVGAATLATVDHALRHQLVQTIDTDIAGLTDVMVQGGPDELRRRIADRTDFAEGAVPHPFYALIGADGARLAGDAAIAPPANAGLSPLIDLPEGLARATRLRGGLTLVVGRSLAPSQALLAGLRRSFVFAALLAILVSLLAGAFSAGWLGRRVAAVTGAFERFKRGDHRRGPSATGRDEIAILAREVDAHLLWSERLLRSQREISDNIAHELRTPLVHLDTRLLRALEANRDEHVAADLADARGDIRSVVSLFDALLDIGMTETGNGLGRGAVDCDLAEIAINVADLYRPSAEEAGLDFSTRIAATVPMRGEPMAIARIIANLLDNALKYAPAGSHVCLAVEEGPRIVVEDDGPGVPPEDRDHIFGRFHRAGAAGPGHGLGLALVRVIAARHGLTARFENADPGARFIIEPPQCD